MYLCIPCDIAHEEKYCPLCNANEKIEELENKIEELKEEIKNT